MLSSTELVPFLSNNTLSELLPGIGNKKAMQMVEQRGSSGFTDIEQLNETCNIDSCELLAKRFVNEIEDKTLQPRLSELLFPVTA